MFIGWVKDGYRVGYREAAWQHVNLLIAGRQVSQAWLHKRYSLAKQADKGLFIDLYIHLFEG